MLCLTDNKNSVRKGNLYVLNYGEKCIAYPSSFNLIKIKLLRLKLISWSKPLISQQCLSKLSADPKFWIACFIIK